VVGNPDADEVETVAPVPLLAGEVPIGAAVEFEAGYGGELDGLGGTVKGRGEPVG
jgi:hypothetical protein